MSLFQYFVNEVPDNLITCGGYRSEEGEEVRGGLLMGLMVLFFQGRERVRRWVLVESKVEGIWLSIFFM